MIDPQALVRWGTALLSTLAAIAALLAGRALQWHGPAPNKAWLLSSLAANLTGVLLLGLTVGMCAYFLRQPARE